MSSLVRPRVLYSKAPKSVTKIKSGHTFRRLAVIITFASKKTKQKIVEVSFESNQPKETALTIFVVTEQKLHGFKLGVEL